MGKRKKTHTDNKSIQPSDKLLLVGYLSLIVLHIIGGFWHSYYSWGFSYWSVFPTNIIIIFGVLSIVVLLATYYLQSKITLDFADRLQFTDKSKSITFIFYTVISVILFLILYYFRSKAHLYGDGYLILDKVLSLKDMFSDTKNFMELFTLYLYYYITTIIQNYRTCSTVNILGFINSFAGVFGVWAIWSISKLISPYTERRVFLFITTLTSASIILFFGYIENYTLALVTSLWTLRFSLGYVKKENGLLSLLMFSFLSIGFHLITFPFLLIGLYAVLLRSDKFQFIKQLKLHFIILLFFLVSLLVVFLSQVIGLTIFVPLWSIPNNPYTLLSFGHLSDILNQLILVAPLIVVFIIFSYKEKNTTDDLSKVLYMVSSLTFLSAIFINPQLGAVRDWDLLSFYGIPFTIYIGYSISNMYENKQFPNWITVASLLIILVHIGPNLYEKNHPQSAVQFLDEVIWNDPHYQSDYQDAYRCRSWGAILLNISERKDISNKYFIRRSKNDNYDSKSLYLLGLLKIDLSQFDSARYYLTKGHKLSPQAPRFLSMLSKVEILSKNYLLAEEYSRESLKLDSNHIFGLTTLGASLNNQNKTEDALYYFRRAYELSPDEYSGINNLGVMFFENKIYDSAFYYMKRAIPLANKSQRIEIIGDIITVVISMNRKEEAIEYLKQLKSLAPNSALVREKEKEIYGK